MKDLFAKIAEENAMSDEKKQMKIVEEYVNNMDVSDKSPFDPEREKVFQFILSKQGVAAPEELTKMGFEEAKEKGEIITELDLEMFKDGRVNVQGMDEEKIEKIKHVLEVVKNQGKNIDEFSDEEK